MASPPPGGEERGPAHRGQRAGQEHHVLPLPCQLCLLRRSRNWDGGWASPVSETTGDWHCELRPRLAARDDGNPGSTTEKLVGSGPLCSVPLALHSRTTAPAPGRGEDSWSRCPAYRFREAAQCPTPAAPHLPSSRVVGAELLGGQHAPFTEDPQCRLTGSRTLQLSHCNARTGQPVAGQGGSTLWLCCDLTQAGQGPGHCRASVRGKGDWALGRGAAKCTGPPGQAAGRELQSTAGSRQAADGAGARRTGVLALLEPSWRDALSHAAPQARSQSQACSTW